MPERNIQSIYFGGGTPSLLNKNELEIILDAIFAHYNVDNQAEITLEANPDDLMPEKLESLKSLGFNRLSIGIQSFNDAVLTFLNRAHNTEMAIQCLHNAKATGFNNISLDLIYAIPGQSKEAWLENIEKAIALSPQHISCYALTIEEKTTFGNWLKKGNLKVVDDEDEALQFELLVGELLNAGFIQYEVSNFSLPGFESRHNSSYWKQTLYLGIGPSAHSYDGESRQYNIKNNHLYIKSIQQGLIPETKELLSKEEKINEYLLTSLRTHWGCDLDVLEKNYAYDIMKTKSDYIQELLNNGLALVEKNKLTLTRKGFLLADKISSDLFTS